MLFFAGLYFADRLVTPAGNLEAFYDEPKRSIDVLIVGSSHTMSAVSPTALYEATGLTAYNLSTWSQPVWVSYYYIKEALKYQTPQLILLDAFSALYDRSYLTGTDVDLVSDDYAQLMKPSFNLLALNLTRRRVQATRKPIEAYFNIARYHSRITELNWSDLTKVVADNSTTGKGFGPMYTVESFAGYAYPATDRLAGLYPHAQEYLEKIITLCKEKHIRLVLIKTPQIADEEDIALLNTIRHIAENAGIDFLDYCSANSLDLDFENDFADHGHLNNFGAKKCTGALAAYLNALGLTAQHSQQITQRWQAAAEVENEDMARMEIRIARSFGEMTERVIGHGKTALILAKQGGNALTQADNAAIARLFTGTPFEAALDDIADHDLFIYAGGQVLMGQQAESWCAQRGITVTRGPVVRIEKDGENYAYGRDGLNIAMYSDESGEIYHYLSYAKEHGYTPYTR